MKNRKGKKRNVSNAVKLREVDRQIKGGMSLTFVVGQSCGKAYAHGGGKGGQGGAMASTRALGVKPDPLTMGRNRDYTMTYEERTEAQKN